MHAQGAHGPAAEDVRGALPAVAEEAHWETRPKESVRGFELVVEVIGIRSLALATIIQWVVTVDWYVAPKLQWIVSDH